MPKPLEWKINGKGDHYALGGVRCYTIEYEGTLAYRVRIDGYPIAKAMSLQSAKDAAAVHNAR